MKIAKNRKHRRVRAALPPARNKRKKYAKPRVQTVGLSLVEKIVEFFDQLAKKEEAKTIRKTKVDEHFEIETRDYSCDCGRPDCTEPAVFLTMAFRDGLPITPTIKATTLEEVDRVHMAAKRRIEQGLAVSQVEATKDLAHALGNCECHGKESPKA